MAAINEEKIRQEDEIRQRLEQRRQIERENASRRIAPVTNILPKIGGVVGDTLTGLWNLGDNRGLEIARKVFLGSPIGAGGVKPTSTVVSPTEVPPPIAAPVATVAAPPVVAPVVRKEKPHPLSQYKDLYDYVSKLDDEKFQKFVDQNEGLQGIGYVKNEKGKITRVIENPADKPAPQMNLEQAKVAAQMQAGVDAREQARTRADVENRKLAFELKKYAEANDMSTPLSQVKFIMQYAPKKKNIIYDEMGMKTGEEEAPDVATAINLMKTSGVPIQEDTIKYFTTTTPVAPTNRPPLSSFKKK